MIKRFPRKRLQRPSKPCTTASMLNPRRITGRLLPTCLVSSDSEFAPFREYCYEVLNVICVIVTVFYQNTTDEKHVERDLPPPPVAQPSTSSPTPATRDWTALPASDFLNAGGRFITDRDAPQSQQQGSRGLLSLFGQVMGRPNVPLNPNPTHPAVMPPTFSRPVPSIPQNSLQWFSPVLIQSRSTRITEGFPLVFPAAEMQTHDVTPEDWQAFLMHIDGMLRSGVVTDPAGHGHAAQMLVAQWSAAFFQPRRLRVTLRPELQGSPGSGYPIAPNRSGRGDVDRSDARSISSVSSTSTSSSSSSSSSDDSYHGKGKGKKGAHRADVGPLTFSPVPSGVAAAVMPPGRYASTMPYQPEYPRDRRADRDLRKAERRAHRDARKAERRARKMERRERKRERKLQRRESKAMRKGKFVPQQNPLSGRWELIVECI